MTADIALAPGSRVGRAQRTDALVRRMSECTDPVAGERLRQELVRLNMPVAASIAGRYRGRGISSEDLRQVAYLALVMAAARFDPCAGHTFLSFCVPTVRGEIRRHFRDHGWMVRPPRPVQELQLDLLRLRAELSQALGREPGVQELADASGHEIDQVLEALDGRGAFLPVSLDQSTGLAEDGMTLGDLIPCESGDRRAAEARLLLAPAIKGLAPRDRQILQLRFFEGLSQREIAEAIGVTQMQVSRLLTRIMRDLRGAILGHRRPSTYAG